MEICKHRLRMFLCCLLVSTDFIVSGCVDNHDPIPERLHGPASTERRCGASGTSTMLKLVQVLAKSQSVPLQGIALDIRGTIDGSHPVRSAVSLFNSVYLRFRMKGMTEPQGQQLVEAYKGR